MRKGESIRRLPPLVGMSPDPETSLGDEISFSGQKSTDFIQAIRTKAFDEDKIEDTNYMVALTSLCLTGLALEWFEGLSDDVQTNWSLLRRALLARFTTSEAGGKGDFISSILGRSHRDLTTSALRRNTISDSYLHWR